MFIYLSVLLFPVATHFIFIPVSLQITKEDLDHRHPQLDSVFTLAQNLKNKTSSLDVRTAITEKCIFLSLREKNIENIL